MIIYLSNNQHEYGILDEWNDGTDKVSFPIFHYSNIPLVIV
jgi:hypothetical protein